MREIIVLIITFITQILYFVVIVDIILSYFMSPYHPIRQTLDRIVEPMLKPIRNMVPSVQMIDFSPMILLMIIWLLNKVLISLFAD